MRKIFSRWRRTCARRARRSYWRRSYGLWASTCAKPGAKAIILPNGTFSEGWIGSGCTRGAVLKAAKDALEDGQSRLISVEPGDLLAKRGITPGDERDGVYYAKNSCPSRGCMDIFVEPMLPRPDIFICGASPVAVATAELAAKLGFAVTACAPAGDQEAFPQVEKRIEGYALPPTSPGERFIVVSTQAAATTRHCKARLRSTPIMSLSSPAAARPRP